MGRGRGRRWPAGVLLVVLALAGCGQAVTPATYQRTVQVGLVSDFSGPAAVAGQQIENSLQVEAERIDAAGGLLGARIEVEAADDAGDPARAAQMVRDQLARDEVGLLVGPTSTATFAAAAPLVARSRLPVCTVQVADPVLERTAAFSPSAPDADRLTALLGYVRSHLGGATAVGLLDQGDLAGQSYDRQLGVQAPRFGLHYLGAVAAGPSGAPAAVQQLVQRGAGAVLVAGDPAFAAAVAVALQQIPRRPALLGLDGLAGYRFLSAAGPAAVGVVLASGNQAYLTRSPSSSWPPGYRSFVLAVQNQYGLAPNGVQLMGLPEAADCLLQWSLAVQRAGSFEGRAAVRAWERLSVPAAETAQGVAERLSSGHHLAVGQDGVFVYTWQRSGGGYRLQPV